MPEIAAAEPNQQDAQATEQRAPAPTAPTTTTANAAGTEPQLASFGDALEKAVSGDKPPRDAGKADAAGAKGASTGGASTDEVTKPQGARDQATPPATTEDESGASTASPDAVTKPDETEVEGEQRGEEKGLSRRGAAKRIAELEAENTTLKAKVVDPPAEVIQQLEQYRLTNEEFARLETKLKHESLTGDRLTPQERERYDTALTVRSWFGPVYRHAEKLAEEWAGHQKQAIFDDQAKALAPLLRERPHVKAEVIAKAESWTDVYGHIAQASEEHGRSLERAELQPKLDEARGRIADLEAELAGLRPSHLARTSRPLERGGMPTGGSNARPNLRTAASASELFDAAFADAERQSRRRAS